MRARACLLFCVWAILPDLALSEVIDFNWGGLQVALPPDFLHERRRGIDTACGLIYTEMKSDFPNPDGIVIEYDVGPLASTFRPIEEMSKETLHRIDYFERGTKDGFKYCLFLWKDQKEGREMRTLQLVLPEAFANFWIRMDTLDTIPGCKSKLMRLRLLKRSREKSAEPGHPANPAKRGG